MPELVLDRAAKYCDERQVHDQLKRVARDRDRAERRDPGRGGGAHVPDDARLPGAQHGLPERAQRRSRSAAPGAPPRRGSPPNARPSQSRSAEERAPAADGDEVRDHAGGDQGERHERSGARAGRRP